MSQNLIKKSRGRPRREGANEQILSVARDMLAEKGYRELTIDAVAERAGVAKTTIYRRWPSKVALVAALIEPPRTSDIETFLNDTEEMLRLCSDPEMFEVVRAELRARREILIRIEATVDADALLGALVMRILVGP